MVIVVLLALGGCESPIDESCTDNQNTNAEEVVGQGSMPSPEGDWPTYSNNPFVIDVLQPVKEHGSIFVHDLNGDTLMDFIVTSPGVVGAYDHYGSHLWSVSDEIRLEPESGYPGWWAPAAIASDMDGDSKPEVAYITSSGDLKILSGATGTFERSYRFPGVEAIALANLRGKGDRDAILQYNQRQIKAVNLETGVVLWHVNDWMGIEHSMVRVVDIDRDGRDEILGPVILDHDGCQLQSAKRNSKTKMSRMDTLAVGDIIPGGGIEIALGEQGGNNETIVLGADRIYWARHHAIESGFGECQSHFDPDKLAVGDFDPTRRGLEVFARSSCGNFPWIMDSSGHVIANWKVGDVAPPGWCHRGDCEMGDPSEENGIDLVRSISWSGSDLQHLLLQERKSPAKVAIVDALTGSFLRVWDVNAERSYAADIAGDYREEVIVVERRGRNKSRILVFSNDDRNTQKRERLWQSQVYRRVRQNWNYYSP